MCFYFLEFCFFIMGEKISFHILSESFEYFGYLYLNIYFKKFIYSYMFEKVNEISSVWG